ncbi:hypothetical protein RhiirA4_482132 [Rhizophagus irregularis]|uniref:SAM domain-containing protein n=1 Tax=Rhizophagus irregularis TaxID=588596 RepID=A0A2I1HKP4_9GLOM|nr:hypothetical protein RhiirA4_482132 [Rhizophagus irregularis]
MSSETSTPYTPASTSTTIAGNETVSLADEIKKYDTAKLIEFLQGRENIGLNEPAIKILENEEVNGLDFFDLTQEELERHGMKLRDSLKEVLAKYDIKSNGTDAIPLFSLQPTKIQDSNKHLGHCVENILFRMKHYGSLVVDSLESMRNEYVSTILHMALHIAEDETSKEFSMRPEFEIIGEESSSRIDYAITLESSYETNRRRKRKREEDDFDYLYGIVTTARDWHFLLYSPGEISQASELPLAIEFNKKALVKDSEEYKTLHSGVKKVLGMVVGMLIDKASAEDESPSKKKARVEGYRSKK